MSFFFYLPEKEIIINLFYTYICVYTGHINIHISKIDSRKCLFVFWVSNDNDKYSSNEICQRLIHLVLIVIDHYIALEFSRI